MGIFGHFIDSSDAYFGLGYLLVEGFLEIRTGRPCFAKFLVISLDMSDKLSAVPVLAAGEDFDFWVESFQAHLLLNKELRPLMEVRTLRAPGDPALDKLEDRALLESLLYSALVRSVGNGASRNNIMWEVIRPFSSKEHAGSAGTTAFAALMEFYRPTKGSGAYLLLERLVSTRIARGETPIEFVARLERMQADVLASTPEAARKNYEATMSPLLKTVLLMMALHDVADEKEYDDFRRRIFADMDSGAIVGDVGDFRKVTHNLHALTNRIALEAESALDSQKAVAFRTAPTGAAGGRAGGAAGKQEKRSCYNCGVRGHVASDCPKPRATCDRCGNSGHLAVHCDDVRRLREARRGASEEPRTVAFMVSDGVSYMDALMKHAPLPSEDGRHVDLAAPPRVCAAAVVEPQVVSDTYLDTCASEHCFKDKFLFAGGLRPCGPVMVADDTPARAAGVGRAAIPFRCEDGGLVTAVLDEVRCCEEFAANLVSWPRLQAKGFTLLENVSGLRHPDGRVFPLVHTPNGPRFITGRSAEASVRAVRNGAGPVEKAVAKKVLWHERLGHLSEGGMRELINGGAATGVDYNAKVETPVCVSCRVMKAHRVPLKGGVVNTVDKKKTLPMTSYKATAHRRRGDVHFGDFFGPVKPAAIGGFPIVFGLAHGKSGIVKVDPLRRKSDLVASLQRYSSNVMQIKALRLDNESVNRSEELENWCAQRDVQLTHCAPYTPEQLAKIERMWRTLGEGACAELHASGLPDEFWGFAMDAMAYVYNRTPRASNEDGVSPMEAHLGVRPDLAHLRVFGCRAFVHVPKARRTKLQPKARVGIFVGYSPASRAYRVWVPKDWSDVRRGTLYESRDVTFDEGWRYGAAASSSSAEPVVVEDDDEGVQGGGGGGTAGDAGAEAEAAGDAGGAGGAEGEDGADDAGGCDPGLATGGASDDAGGADAEIRDGGAGGAAGGGAAVLRRSERQGRGQGGAREWWKVEPAPGQSTSVEVGAGEDMEAVLREAVAFLVKTSDPNAPSLREALAGPEREQYLEAIKKERDSLTARGVFTCIPESAVPAGATVLTSEYLVRKKLLANGDLDKYKGRSVVHGNRQKAGRDYDPNDLFAPVARFTSLRVLVALAAGNGWRLRQFDVETAFLYADLDEEIYVRPPKEFPEYVNGSGGERVVWKLHKSLYGLRQAPRNWFTTFATFLIDYGFKKSLRDPCVFVYTDGETGELQGIFVLHVDDVPNGVAGADEWYEAFLRAMKQRFNFKEGPLEWCLGVEVLVESDSVVLRQTKYVREVLERFGMQDCKPASVPLDPGAVFSLADSPQNEGERAEMKQMPYRALVGSLLYCAVATRPDIALAVSKISHVMSNPGPTHFRRALYMLRYLKATMHMGIRYSKRSVEEMNVLVAYSDADFAGCPDTFKSTSGYVCFLNGGPVSWMSKLQQPVATSTTEAEYMAASYCVSEVVFLRGILEDFTYVQGGPTVLHEDNQGAVCLAKNEVNHSRAKHINVRYHQLRSLIADKVVEVRYCRTDENVADVMTKILPRVVFEKHRPKLMGYA